MVVAASRHGYFTYTTASIISHVLYCMTYTGGNAPLFALLVKADLERPYGQYNMSIWLSATLPRFLSVMDMSNSLQ